MFQFPAFAPLRGNTSSRYWVPPFGNPRIKGHLRLPAAYRSLSRPSSPLRAKASPVRSYLTFSSRVSIVKTCFIADSLGRPLQLTFDSWVCISADFSLFSYMSLVSNMSNSSRTVSCLADRMGSLPGLPYRSETVEIASSSRLQLFFLVLTVSLLALPNPQTSLERRYSSRTFRYGYLVTT